MMRTGNRRKLIIGVAAFFGGAASAASAQPPGAAALPDAALPDAALPDAALADADAGESLLDYHRRMFQQATPTNFDLGGPVSRYVHKNFGAFYRQAAIARKAPARALPERPRKDFSEYVISVDGAQTSFDDYVRADPQIDGVIALHRGEIIYERYTHMAPYDRHFAWSVTKVFASTALAALDARGRADMNAAVEVYAPELAGSDWAGTRLRDIVNMASGMGCHDSEGYQNTDGCIYRLEESLGLTAPVHGELDTIEVLRGVARERPPGEAYAYKSADTTVIGLVVENITQTPWRLAVQDLLWAPMGAEADGMIAVSPDGLALSHAGLSLRLRDVARFGQIFTREDGLGVVGRRHFEELRGLQSVALSAENKRNDLAAFGDDDATHAAWQWDRIWPDGAMFKGGYSGQGIYVDPDRDFIFAFFGTASLDGRSHALARLARDFSKSGLLD